MHEDKQNKEEDMMNYSTSQADRLAGLSTTRPNSLRRTVLTSAHEMLLHKYEARDDRITDEVLPWVLSPADMQGLQDDWVDELPTLILPAIELEQITSPIVIAQKAGDMTESHLALIKKLIKTSGMYALASMAPPFVALILAPFLTHHLTPTEYGILTILNTLISLGVGITQLGLSTAFFRAYGYDYVLEQDRLDVLSTVTGLLSLISVTTMVGIAVLSPFLARLLLGQVSFGGLVTLAGAVILVQNLTVPGFALLRVENRAIFYSLLAVGNVLITLLVSIVLVGVLHRGIAGALIATGCGYASGILFMIPWTVLRAGIKIRADIARSMLTFGAPLSLNFISYWVLQVSDRYLLSLFGSFAQTASYAVAYSLGSIVSVAVIGPFTLAWPTAMFSIARRKDAAKVFGLIFRWLSLLLPFAAFGFSLVGKLLLYWLFPVSYYSAAAIIPLIAMSIVFYGVYYLFMIGANVMRKTWLAALFMTVAALVNLGSNLALISHEGAMGAALSTLVAFVVLSLLAYFVNQRIYPIPFEMDLFFTAVVLGVALYTGSNFLAQTQKIFVDWGINFGAFGLYGACLVALGMLRTRMVARSSNKGRDGRAL